MKRLQSLVKLGAGKTTITKILMRLYPINKGKVITHEYFNCHSAKGTDRTSQSVFKKDKKIIKNLGYLNAAKYNKYRDSYKTVTSSINFVKNTSANRNNILKANTRTAK